MRRKLLLTSILLSIPYFFLFAQQSSVENYVKVNIEPNSHQDIQHLMKRGLAIDHYHGKLHSGIQVVLSESEMNILRESGIQHNVLVPNMKSFYERRRNAQPSTRSAQSSATANAFGYGSMGGFYTFSEVVSKLDEMRSNYPSLVTSKMNIGSSFEGRTIWAVKISDNPDTDESASEAPVHYDALHHAREPLSMAVTINYMFWLLENYGSNAEVTYLINNRELFFIPVVNPDGYEYNRQTDPNGGGLWRKNRRDVASSSCFGVDLNRNYSYQWGLNSGSSSNPCSNTYRGTSSFSEPETQAVRDFVNAHNPVIAFSIHSTAGSYLHPFGYATFAEEYETYSDFSCEMLAENDYPYGVTFEMLGYTSSGTTRDWLHGSKGTYAWTPEIDGSGFWPNQSEIFGLVDENITSCKFIAWVAGAYTGVKSYRVQNNKSLLINDNVNLIVELLNKGLSMNANNVQATLSSSNPDITITNGTASYASISPRSSLENTTPYNIALNSNFSPGDEITLTLVVQQDNVTTETKTLKFYVGDKNVLLSENAEAGTGSLSRSGTSNVWDTSYVDSRGELHCFADSRYGNLANNVNAYLTSTTIALGNAEHPRVEFWAKWGHETNSDYTRFQISTNGGSSWTSLSGAHTTSVGGTPSYTSVNNWIEEHIDLSSYIGQNIQLRFFTHTDGGLPGDGFYFDDFKVTDYKAVIGPPTCTDGIQNGNETGVDCGGPDCPTCPPTCTDGVQNGNETDIDCGGPDCPACPTCSDGAQNGNETGVDCGGPDCIACPVSYCASSASNTNYEFIERISIGSINNTSGSNGGYADYTNLSTNLDESTSNAITLVPGFVNSSYSESWSVWIDFNYNGSFSDAGELVFQGSGTGTVNGTVTIPANIQGITTRMRVTMQYNGSQNDPCASFTYGEVEDYSIVLVPAVAPTCTDGVQNGNETGVDCGGPDCAVCPTCTDGVQNGSETDIDCGGPDCAACPTCTDGVQNGSETGVDCGGPDCAVCPTCTDGVQNGSETDIDCGGPDCAACPTCTDGVQNGNETDVDCGGPDCAACPTCTDGVQNGSETDIDCGGPDCAVCPTCTDGVQNGSETDIDCGGPDCAACPTCTDGVQNGSETGVDCGGPDCVVCPTCTDGVQNGSETDIDCGGPDCAACPTCTDGVQNGNETDVDCGGPDCAACPTCTDGVQNGSETGVDCGGPDCAVCPTCTDGVQNGSETDIDCGGPDCAACPTCTDGVQNGNETGVDCGGPDCAACPTCTDGVQNGNETDIDCGGPDCAACPTCTDGIQNGGETDIDCGGPDCAACPTCTDGIQNGNETDVDCGGPDCPTCPPTCTDGIQNGNETDVDCGGPDCAACPTCTDGIQNGNETDVDCGGPDCAACPTCTDGIQNGNETGVDCGGPDCTACPTCTDGVQNGNETDIDCGGPDCPACPTCTDGTQNGNEIGVDCGGPDCPPCPACTDGTQNGNETDVDCGGPDCPDCPTCTDGIQNGNETGVDCGGSDCPTCPPTCTDGIQNGNETGVDCGGPDCPPCSTCIGTVINSYPYSESFENGLGDWTQVGGDDFDWSRRSGGTPSNNTGPSSAADGTFYMYTESSTPNYSNKTAIFEGPCFNLNSETFAVFNFKYHMYGASNMGGLTFDISTDDGDTWNTVWSQNGNQGNLWIDASISLQAYLGSTIKVRFFGTTGTTWRGDMAVDDIGLSTSAPTCTNIVSTFPYVESFESGLGLWEQSALDNLNWTQRSGGTPSNGTGPSGAQNGSQYIYIEASSPNYPSKRAIINGPCFDAVSSSELTFYYHMLGSAVGTLDVEVSEDVGVTWASVWTLSGDQGSSWTAASVDLSGYAGQEIMVRFNGLTGASWQGDICIDNIEIQSGAAIGNGITLRAKDKKPEANFAPNPFSDYISVRSERPIHRIFVYSLTGQLVHQNEWNDFINQDAINLSKLAPGLYLVEITFKDGDSQRSQIIKH